MRKQLSTATFKNSEQVEITTHLVSRLRQFKNAADEVLLHSESDLKGATSLTLSLQRTAFHREIKGTDASRVNILIDGDKVVMTGLPSPYSWWQRLSQPWRHEGNTRSVTRYELSKHDSVEHLVNAVMAQIEPSAKEQGFNLIATQPKADARMRASVLEPV